MINEFWLWQVPGYAHWGWKIALYLFLGGVGGGAYATAAVAEYLARRYENKGYEAIARAGGYLGLSVLIVGSVVLLLDLGDPIRGILVPISYINPSSWMAVGAWLLLFLIILGLGYVYAWRKGTPGDTRYRLALVNGLLGIGVAAYTGFLLKGAPFVPLWHTNLLPLLFTVSAMSTGLAGACLLALVPSFAQRTPELEEGTSLFSRLDGVLIVAELLVIAVFVKMVAGTSATGLQSVSLITRGQYAPAFWGGVIALGLVLPLLLAWLSHLRESLKSRILPLEFTFVLFGGAVLRYVILYGAIKQPIVIP
jgi:formate-dependent nitrite reductase membrane component NrfD